MTSMLNKQYLKALYAKQLGQAMTEMLVASSFVLVPLFLVIPLVGKYIDIKQATVSAARYVAWERTVYFKDANDQYPSGFSVGGSHQRPMKNDVKLKDEVLTRVYSEPNTGFNSTSVSGLSTFTGRQLWVDHTGAQLLTNTDSSESNLKRGTIEGTFASVINTVGTAIRTITSILSFGRGSFDVIKLNGNNEVTTSLAVNAPPLIGTLNQTASPLLTTNGLVFEAKAQVYSYAWSAGGQEHLSKQVVPLVPTQSLGYVLEQFNLNNLISGANVSAQDIASIVLLSPEIDDDFLEFGKMDLDVLPRDKYIYKDGTETVYEEPFSQAQSDAYQATPATPDVCNNQGYCRE